VAPVSALLMMDGLDGKCGVASSPDVLSNRQACCRGQHHQEVANYQRTHEAFFSSGWIHQTPMIAHRTLRLVLISPHIVGFAVM